MLDDRTIAFPSYDGNGMYLSGGNVEENPEVDLLFLDLEICTLRRNAREGPHGGDDDWMCPGWSAIVSPEGELAAGPLSEEEGFLYSEVDAGAARASRVKFDPCGHYARTDVFRLSVDTQARQAVSAAPAAAAVVPAAEVGS